MLNLRQKSINISRYTVLEKLKENLAIHTAQYAEALDDYKKLIAIRLTEALKQVNEGTPAAAAEVRVKFDPPTDHRKDFEEVIEMLEYSLDDVLNLDQESFKAYIKNEWSWSQSFSTSNALYKGALAAAGF